ncbi:MAG: hypothetical protein OXT71_14300 [Acidobacteriota bacterium]|nr:hypothetical protein [Acidobacteriota bacterium]
MEEEAVTHGIEPLLPYVPNADEQFSFLMGEDFVEKHNIAWRVELAEEEPANPLIEPELPWENACAMSHGTVMVDPTDGLWKAWYVAVPKHPYNASAERRLAYAESTDGVNWVKPELDICSYQGQQRTNILIDLKSGGPAHNASVIVHPEAPPDRRYEMFILRLPGWYCPYRVVKGFPVPAGQEAHQKGEGAFSPGLYRYRSADGKHWEPWESAGFPTADGGWVTQLADGSYAAYHKSAIPALPGGLSPYDVAVGVCRVIMRRTGRTGSDWSAAELALIPDWQDPNDTQFMELSPLQQRNGFVGIATVYHTWNQTVDFQFAASRDGKSWWRPDRRACVPLRALGDFGGGMTWPMHPMVHHGGRIYVYYCGCEGLHNDYMSTEPAERMRQAELPEWPHYWQPLALGNDTRSPVAGLLWFTGGIGRASWEVGRLWAAVTAAGGYSTGDLLTRTAVPHKHRVVVNAVTVGEGKLEAELVSGGKPVAGFSRSDCQPVRGDHRAGAIRWKGGDRCPVGDAQLRFYIHQARLYGIDFLP